VFWGGSRLLFAFASHPGFSGADYSWGAVGDPQRGEDVGDVVADAPGFDPVIDYNNLR
jgi:hypothetical protein